MDDLSAHKGSSVRELVEGRGKEIVDLPPYLPDLNPIRQASSKMKALMREASGRSREAPDRGEALSSVTTHDTSGFFRYCGSRTLTQFLRYML